MRIFATGWSDDVDGPGRRLVVYLKGCNFRCRWCANPEGMNPSPEMLFYPGRSAFAEAACPYGAVRGAHLDRDRCAACLGRPCVRIAHDPAFDFAGAELSVADLVARAEAARPLLASQGGVTFAGGEPTLQADEVLHAAEALRAMRIHTAVETNASTPDFGRFPGQVDLIIADVKCISPNRHREYIGVDNALVPGNLAAAQHQSDLLVRVTLVTGFNDGDDEQTRLAEFLGRLRLGRDRLRAQVLRLHHVGEPKYAALEIEYPMKGVPHPPEQKARDLEARLAEAGLDVEPPWSPKK